MDEVQERTMVHSSESPEATTSRSSCQVHSLAEFVADEMAERGWVTDDVAVRMHTNNGPAVDLFCLDLFLSVQDDALLIDADFFGGLARAFKCSETFLRNLHRQWQDHPQARVPFDCPNELFGPTSRRAMMRIVPSNVDRSDEPESDAAHMNQPSLSKEKEALSQNGER